MTSARILFWAPVAAMIMIAGLQHYLVRAHQLSPWEGGGFGMFSTSDAPGTRALRVSVVSSDGIRHPAKISYDQRDVRKLLAMPTFQRAKALAVDLARKRWEPSDFDPLLAAGDGAKASSNTYAVVRASASPLAPKARDVSPLTVMVEVIRCRLDASSGTAVVSPIVSVEQRWTGP